MRVCVCVCACVCACVRVNWKKGEEMEGNGGEKGRGEAEEYVTGASEWGVRDIRKLFYFPRDKGGEPKERRKKSIWFC